VPLIATGDRSRAELATGAPVSLQAVVRRHSGRPSPSAPSL